MSEIDGILKFIDHVASEIGYTGAFIATFIAVFAYLVLRNMSRQTTIQSRLIEAIMASNALAAQQRTEEAKQDASLLSTVLSRQATILDGVLMGLSNVLAGFEKFGALVNTNGVLSEAVLDEIRTHEHAAKERWGKAYKEHQKTREIIAESAEVVQKAHIETRLAINPIASNTHSLKQSMQGVDASMANLSDRIEKRLAAIEQQLAEAKVLLSNLPDCNNEAAIRDAVKTITGKLDTIEDLVKKDEKPDGNN